MLGTAIYNVSNLCTAVGGDQNKEFMGKKSFRGKIYIACKEGKWNDSKKKTKFMMFSLIFTVATQV